MNQLPVCTGMIKLVFMDVVKKVDGGQTKGMEPPSFKKMIRTNIPEGTNCYNNDKIGDFK